MKYSACASPTELDALIVERGLCMCVNGDTSILGLS